MDTTWNCTYHSEYSGRVTTKEARSSHDEDNHHRVITLSTSRTSLYPLGFEEGLGQGLGLGGGGGGTGGGSGVGGSADAQYKENMGIGSKESKEGGQEVDCNIWGYHHDEEEVIVLSNFDTWKSHNFDLEQLPDDDVDVMNDKDGCSTMGKGLQGSLDFLI